MGSRLLLLLPPALRAGPAAQQPAAAKALVWRRLAVCCPTRRLRARARLLLGCLLAGLAGQQQVKGICWPLRRRRGRNLPLWCCCRRARLLCRCRRRAGCLVPSIASCRSLQGELHFKLRDSICCQGHQSGKVFSCCRSAGLR
jgi:hypothetical protein